MKNIKIVLFIILSLICTSCSDNSSCRPSESYGFINYIGDSLFNMSTIENEEQFKFSY